MQPSAKKGVYQAPLNESTKAAEAEAKAVFGSLIQESQYVGDVYSLGYESALVLIHDFHRQKVGGLPRLSFLIATRITPQQVLPILVRPIRHSTTRLRMFRCSCCVSWMQPLRQMTLKH